MNLYYISQDANTDYDTYRSAVVAAETERDARETHPSGGESYRDTWAPANCVKVELIGTAKEGTKAGVICADFNAG